MRGARQLSDYLSISRDRIGQRTGNIEARLSSTNENVFCFRRQETLLSGSRGPEIPHACAQTFEPFSGIQPSVAHARPGGLLVRLIESRISIHLLLIPERVGKPSALTTEGTKSLWLGLRQDQAGGSFF